MGYRRNSLGRKEILRGFRVYQRIFEKGVRITSGNITVHIERSSMTLYPVIVGFFVSKKKLENLTIETE